MPSPSDPSHPPNPSDPPTPETATALGGTPTPAPSRRTVLATGSALGGTLITAGLATPAAAAPSFTAAGNDLAPSLHPDAWRTVLADADMVWRQLPRTWYEGPYLGNGFLGSGIYAEPGAETRAIRFNVQHSEVQDHRPEFGSLFGLARLPIGYFTLEPVGTITALDWRLDLRRAEHLLNRTLSDDGSFSTLAGYVLEQLGRLPREGDSLDSEGLRFEVMAMDGARIERLRVTPAD